MKVERTPTGNSTLSACTAVAFYWDARQSGVAVVRGAIYESASLTCRMLIGSMYGFLISMSRRSAGLVSSRRVWPVTCSISSSSQQQAH